MHEAIENSDVLNDKQTDLMHIYMDTELFPTEAESKKYWPNRLK